MGKDQSVKKQKSQQLRHNPLLEDIEADKVAKPIKNRTKLKQLRKKEEEEEEEVCCYRISCYLLFHALTSPKRVQQFLPNQLSAKLLKEVRIQQAEIEQAERR